MSGKRCKNEEETRVEDSAGEDRVEAEGFILALSTVPDARTAGRIAKKVVEERLAACVNIVGPLKSVFRWEGRVEQTDERLLVMKTTVDRTAALGARIVELHPYEVPEFLSLPVIGGARGYLEWIMASVGGTGPTDDADD